MHLLFIIIIFPVLYIRYIFIICFLCSVVLWSMLLINLGPCFYSQHPEQRYGLADVNHSLHQQISYEAALQSLVLLKNDGALPINEGVKIAVVGPHSISRNGLFSDYAASSHCFNGTDACVPTIAEGLAAANQGGSVSAAMGVEINSNKTDGISAALDTVRKSDFVVLALGDNKSVETEGLDRVDTALPGLQEDFAKKVLALGKPTVIVLVSGGPMAIDDLLAYKQQTQTTAAFAIVQAFYPSQKGAHALGKTLFGKENRWGKLPLTMYPHKYISEQAMTNYDMSAAPGRTYKYYQGEPLFPFGFGLSLTSFSFNCSNVKATSYHSLPFTCTCEVHNTGKLDGEEVLQVYHAAVDIGKVDHPLPKRALRDFKRVAVPAGQRVNVSFNVLRTELELVNKQGQQTLYPGVHAIIISRGHVSWFREWTCACQIKCQGEVLIHHLSHSLARKNNRNRFQMADCHSRFNIPIHRG